MMAHDDYLGLISLSFDGLLGKDEENTLYQHLRTCAACADMWARMNSLDRLLLAQPEIAPPGDFTAQVMDRVSAYEAHRRAYPWMIVVLVFCSLLAGLSLATPALLLSPGFARVASGWPVIGTALAALAIAFDTLVAAATLITEALIDWLVFVTSEPLALAVVIAALVAASTYIGLREASRALRSAEAYQQQSA